MGFSLFKSKKEKALIRVLDPAKDNISRIKAFDVLEEEARKGDEESITTLLRCFHITVKPDKQEQTLTPYDDEQEKWSLIERLSGLDDQRPTVLRLLRKALANPPLLAPGRRDGIVWLIELLKAMAEATTEDSSQSAQMVAEELVRALEAYDPEETYRDPGRKIELIRALGQHRTNEARESIVPFLADVDETVRFQSIEALGTAGDDSLGEALARVVLDDESLRLRRRAGEVLAELNCVIKGHPRRKELESGLPPEIMVDKKGVVKRRAST
jgi:hypothetical protein